VVIGTDCIGSCKPNNHDRHLYEWVEFSYFEYINGYGFHAEGIPYVNGLFLSNPAAPLYSNLPYVTPVT